MEEERSFMHTLILGVCVLICGILIARMAFYRPTPYFEPHRVPARAEDTPQADDTALELRLTEGELTGWIDTGLPEDSPVRDVVLSIREGGTVELAATLFRDRMTELLQTVGQPLPRTLVTLLPEECELQAALTVSCGENGISLHAKDVRAGNFHLPEAVTEPLCDRAADALNAMLQKKGIIPHAIETEDGTVLVETA